MLEIQSWGFPTRMSQLREIAEELSQAKGDYKELGTNWNMLEQVIEMTGRLWN